MDDKRKHKRLTLDESFTVHCLGEPCRLADISLTGLGITFIGEEDWPENIMLGINLPQEADQKRFIQCRTIWESGMVFQKVTHGVTVRRRGVEFVNPGSTAVDDLFRHLNIITKADQ